MSDYLREQEQERLLHDIADCVECENKIIGFCDEHQLRYDRIRSEIYPMGRSFIHKAYIAKHDGYVPHA